MLQCIERAEEMAEEICEVRTALATSRVALANTEAASVASLKKRDAALAEERAGRKAVLAALAVTSEATIEKLEAKIEMLETA